MIIDSLSTFDPAGTPITAGGSSTNILDVQGFSHDVGLGPALSVVVQSSGTFAASGAATLTIQLQGSPDAATWTTYADSGPISIATLNASPVNAQSPYAWLINLPGRRGSALPRYYRLNYVVATGPFAAGTVQAWLGEPPDQIIVYPSGIPAPSPFL